MSTTAVVLPAQCNVKVCLMMTGGKLSDEELGMLVGHAHTRIQQLQNQLAEAKVSKGRRAIHIFCSVLVRANTLNKRPTTCRNFC